VGEKYRGELIADTLVKNLGLTATVVWQVHLGRDGSGVLPPRVSRYFLPRSAAHNFIPEGPEVTSATLYTVVF